jgi:hypothetical protein
MLNRKKILVFIILLMLMSSLGCLKQVSDSMAKVNLNFASKTMEITKGIYSSIGVYSSTISYESKYQEPQQVIITLRASDERIGLSWEASGTFKPSISWTQEMGIEQPNSKNFYIFILNSSIPLGKYDIYGSIKGGKSNDISNDTMTIDYK